MSEKPTTPDDPERSRSLWDDPVVEQVREARRRLWEAAGRDVRRYVERAHESDRRRRAERAGSAKE